MFLKIKASEVLDGVYLKQLSYKSFAMITQANTTTQNYDQAGAIIKASVFTDPNCATPMFATADEAMDSLSIGLVNDLMREILAFNGVSECNEQ